MNLSEIPSNVQTRSYLGVASVQYGRSFDIACFCRGGFDKAFNNWLYLHQVCKVFDDRTQALRETSRQAVTDDSAYVVGLSCSSAEAASKIQAGQLSHLITEVVNATTGKLYGIVT